MAQSTTRVRHISRAIERAMHNSDIPGVTVVQVTTGVTATSAGLPATDELLAALEGAWNPIDLYESVTESPQSR